MVIMVYSSEVRLGMIVAKVPKQELSEYFSCFVLLVVGSLLLKEKRIENLA